MKVKQVIRLPNLTINRFCYWLLVIIKLVYEIKTIIWMVYSHVFILIQLCRNVIIIILKNNQVMCRYLKGRELHCSLVEMLKISSTMTNSIALQEVHLHQWYSKPANELLYSVWCRISGSNTYKNYFKYEINQCRMRYMRSLFNLTIRL